MAPINIEYDRHADILSVDLGYPVPGYHIEPEEGILIRLDENQNVVGFEVQSFMARLAKYEVVRLPFGCEFRLPEDLKSLAKLSA